MKYRIGDKVRIKSDLKVGMEYDGWELLPMMEKYLGKELIITEVLTEFYMTEGNCFSWTDEMIAGLVEEETIKPNQSAHTLTMQAMGFNNNKYHEDLMRISAMAMQGLLAANATYNRKTNDYKSLAKDSILSAKELLTQLKLEQK